MRKTLCLILVIMLIFTLSSCTFDYDGDHPELYTVAVNNIFGIRGYLSNGEVSYDPVIDIIETDKYGRVLFLYSEYYKDSFHLGNWGIAFVIMQKCEDDFVYYYQDLCYLPYCETVDDYDFTGYDEIKDNLDPQLIEDLKTNNGWNTPIDVSKCLKTKVDAEIPEGKLDLRDSDFDDIVIPYAEDQGYTGNDDSHCYNANYCNADKYGRELYYVSALTHDKDENGSDVFEYYDYAVIVNPDGTFPENAVIEINDASEIYDIIKDLKQTCDWNKPF